MATPSQFIIATLNDGKLHPIFRDTIVYLGKVASVGLKVPYYIVLNCMAPRVKFEQDSPFWLMAQDKTGELVLGKSSEEIRTKGGVNPIKVHGEQTFIPICFEADMEGEYICKMQVGYQYSPDYFTSFNLGVEAVGENEVYKINLINKGIEIPNGVSRALYATNLEQGSPDFAILNKKWRELLINYMELMGGKGNSKQIVDSLEWFGYGDKIELREVWKVDTLDGPKMFDRKFTPIVDDEVRELMMNAAKTTYLTIRHIPDAKFDVDPQQSFIETLDKPWEWSKEIMRSKMCLLGNFYETFFLPVHMNVLHSVVEDIYRGYFTDGTNIRVSTAGLEENVYSPYKLAKITTKVGDFQELEGFINLMGHPIPYGSKHNPDSDKPAMAPSRILGFIRNEDAAKIIDIKDITDNILYMWHGPGAIVHVKMEIPKRYKDENVFKGTTVKLVTNITGEQITAVHSFDMEGTSIEFDLLAQKTGTYNIFMEVDNSTTDEDRIYVGNVNFELPDTSQIELHYHKFVYNANKFKAKMPALEPIESNDGEKLLKEFEYAFELAKNDKTHEAEYKALQNSNDALIDKYMEAYSAFDYHKSMDQSFLAIPAGDDVVISNFYMHPLFEPRRYTNENKTGICWVYNYVIPFVSDDEEDERGEYFRDYSDVLQTVRRRPNSTWPIRDSVRYYWVKHEVRDYIANGKTSKATVLTFIFDPSWTEEDIDAELKLLVFLQGGISAPIPVLIGDDLNKPSKMQKFIPGVHDLVEVRSHDSIDVTKFITIAAPTITFINQETQEEQNILIYTNEMGEQSSWEFRDATNTLINAMGYVRNPIIPVSSLGQLNITFSWNWSGVNRSVTQRSPRLFIPTYLMTH